LHAECDQKIMKTIALTCIGVFAALAAFFENAPAAVAQQTPAIGYVYPAGGQAGETFEVTIGGQFLRGVNGAIVSGSGVHAKVADRGMLITQMEVESLREKMRALQEKRRLASGLGPSSRPTSRPAGKASSQAASKSTSQAASSIASQPVAVVWTAEDQKLVEELTEKLAVFMRGRAVPALADIVTLQITIDADAAPGRRELRLDAAGGASNPLAFDVGTLPEFSRKPAKGEAAFGISGEFRSGRPPRPAEPQPDTNITLPAVVNGQLTAGAVDRYAFAARKGRRLVIAAEARELHPYIADAVPGWLQAVLVVCDAQGHEIAYADHFRFHPDPVVYVEIPTDGQYTLQVRDALYRGREDFVYRVSLGELPYVTSAFPLGGRAGERTSVELTGWNLTQTKVTMDCTDKSASQYLLPIGGAGGAINRVPFAADSLPECMEKEPNDDAATAQAVALPIMINGRIDKPGDCDVFSFKGSAGDKVVAEVYARRLGSSLDSAITLVDANGKQLAFNDDHEDAGAALTTHQADSWLSATLPADGTYYVQVCDVQHKGGPEYAYRLRISAPEPDFELRVMPSAINARSGGSIPLTVHAIRKDGFAGEISLALKNAPKGYSLAGGRLQAQKDEVRMTLSGPREFNPERVSLEIEGKAVIDGHDVVRKAAPADNVMQAFAYWHLAPADNLLVTVIGRPLPAGAGRVLSTLPLKIPAGGAGKIEVGMPITTVLGEVHVDLNAPPDGISIQSTSVTPRGTEIVIQSDSAKVKPGQKGNLLFSISIERPPQDGKTRPNMRRISLGTLPAVPFEVVQN